MQGQSAASQHVCRGVMLSAKQGSITHTRYFPRENPGNWPQEVEGLKGQNEIAEPSCAGETKEEVKVVRR